MPNCIYLNFPHHQRNHFPPFEAESSQHSYHYCCLPEPCLLLEVLLPLLAQPQAYLNHSFGLELVQDYFPCSLLELVQFQLLEVWVCQPLPPF